MTVPPDGSGDDEPDEHPARAGQTFDYVGDARWRELQQAAWDAGWAYKKKKKGLLWLAPNGKSVLVHGTPSDHRAFKNSRSLFRQYGVDV